MGFIESACSFLGHRNWRFNSYWFEFCTTPLYGTHLTLR